MKPETTTKTNTSTLITNQQAETLHKLFLQKRGNSKEIQTNFWAELDKELAENRVHGITDAGNFRVRLSSLTPESHDYLYKYLEKLDDNK